MGRPKSNKIGVRVSLTPKAIGNLEKARAEAGLDNIDTLIELFAIKLEQGLIVAVRKGEDNANNQI